MSLRLNSSFVASVLAALGLANAVPTDEPWHQSVGGFARGCGSCRTEMLTGQRSALVESALFLTPSPTRNLGAKSVLVMLVDFADFPGGNTTPGNAVQVVENVGRFYEENSYGQMSLSQVHATPVLRMPKTATAYVAMGSPLQLLFDAREAAEAAGYAVGGYDFQLVSFTYIGFPWSGLGFIGERGAFAQDFFLSRATVAHELGHNMGLWHAGSWEAPDDSIIGSGNHVEYGNPFDIMGGSLNGHFSANFKVHLGWLRPENIVTITNTGTFRLHAMDVGGALIPEKRYALRIPGTPTPGGIPRDYWIDFRQQYTNNPWARNGAILKWGSDFAGGLNSHLLDTTPGTPEGAWDAPLLVGRTFSDRERGLHITPVAKAGEGEQAHVDVFIQLGNPSNQPPVVSLIATTTTANPGESVRFAATAPDTDGDILSYHWDFGDRSVDESSLNQPQSDKRWVAEGEYLVRCTVSDRRGGEASASFIVRVGNPNTRHISGRVEALGFPLAGVRVHTGSTPSDYRAAYTDDQGRFKLVGLPNGRHPIFAAKAGHVFAPAFPNPIRVESGDRTNLLFNAAPNGMPLIAGFDPPGGNVGDTISVHGFHFAGVAAVKLGELVASHTIVSSTQLLLTIPQGALTGPIHVSSPAGIDTSVESLVVAPSPPFIVAPPRSQTVVARTTVGFDVLSSGSGPLSFRWRKDGGFIANATNATLTIFNVQTNQAGAYDVVLTNPWGSATSAVATLTVDYTPTFEEALEATSLAWRTAPDHPWTTQTGLNHDGEDAAMSGPLNSSVQQSWLETTIAGPAELNFWWRLSPGSRLDVTRFNPQFAGTLLSYDGPDTNWQRAALYLPDATNIVRWTGQKGAAFNNPRVWLDQVSVRTVDGTAPRILDHPQAQVTTVGSTVTLRVRADGYQPLRYQWFKINGPGFYTATNDTLTLTNVSQADSGYYGVYVWNLLGSVFSESAWLAVNPPVAPVIFILSPADNASVLSSGFTITVAAVDPDRSNGIARVEFFNGTNKLGEATSAPFSFPVTNLAPCQRLNLVARATDTDGISATTAPTHVRVIDPAHPCLDFIRKAESIVLEWEDAARWMLEQTEDLRDWEPVTAEGLYEASSESGQRFFRLRTR